MSQDIIITAHPYTVFFQTDFWGPPQGGSAAGPGVAMGQMVLSEMATKDNVKVDPDAATEEIVVVGKRIKDTVTQVAVASAVSSGGGWAAGFTAPCVGRIAYAEIAGNAKNMTWRLSTQNFGAGRAGENLAGSSGTAVPVNINATAALDYSKLTNGLIYLVTHEIAHSLTVMQQYNNAQWQQYVARFPGLTQEQLVAAYPDSPEFAANEARSNTVAKAIAQKLGMGAMSPDPTHGYQVC